jgi:hypothetical protein
MCPPTARLLSVCPLNTSEGYQIAQICIHRLYFGQLEGLLRLGNGNHETPPPEYFLFRMSVASVWRLG